MLRSFCFSDGLFFLGEYPVLSFNFLFLSLLIFLYHRLKTSLYYSFINYWEVPNFCGLILILCETTHHFFLLFLSPRRILLFSLSFNGIWFFFSDSWFGWHFIFLCLSPSISLLFVLFSSGAFPALPSLFFYYFLFWQCSFNTQLVVVAASVLREGKWLFLS